MNGAHDLGGMHGFGSVRPEPEDQEPVFHAEWERRVFALALTARALGVWNIDASRHARERQHPVTYLSHSYYENWLAGLEKLLLENGLVTAEELASGKAAGRAAPDVAGRVVKLGRLATLLDQGVPTLPASAPPRFQPGDRIRALNRHPSGHTREPRYVRGRTGVIDAYYGNHIFPDLAAHGIREGHHLYSVRFEAAELWGQQGGTGAVYADLWEDYLEPFG